VDVLAKILIICCVVLACNQTQRQNKIPEMSDLYQYWVHSNEEYDATQRYRTYRPATYPFPPSRGRDGFEIREKGILISHPIAPTDGSISIEGRWTLDGDELTFIGKTATYRYKIISLSKEKLVLKSLPAK
jgi:hypothetical protein